MSGLLWYWMILAAAFVFGTTYTALVWWQVRGVHGLVLVVMQSCLAVIASMMAMIVSDEALISSLVAAIVIRTGVCVVTFAVLVLADLYAASHNDHRSLTTKTYLWWKSLAKERSCDRA